METGMTEYTSLITLSIVYSLTICSLTCLPSIGIYLMGAGQGFRDGLVSAFYFIGGKLLIYGTWGGLAGGFGQVIELSPSQTRWSGLLVIAAALAMPFVSRKTKASCRCQQIRRTGKRLPLIALGASTSLVPCPPMAAILLLAANKGSVFTGITYGLVFGAGLMISPLVAASGSMALISDTIRQKVNWIGPYLQGVSMAIMFGMGLKILL